MVLEEEEESTLGGELLIDSQEKPVEGTQPNLAGDVVTLLSSK
jgi:hypothetical protein